ncbi:MAG: trehalose-6-phosphate synthase, partial [Acidimicrobiales bacterium]
WADSFRSCCREVLGSTPRTFVSPISADPADLARVARSPECLRAGEELDGVVAGRRLILRVDRMELSKNLLRGFQAYSEVLERRPDLRRQVVFMAVTYPSRERLAQYRNYRDEVEAMVASINSRWGSAGWEPIVLEISDDFPRSVAALQRYDVLVVNPVRDGLNLVAKEGSLVNRRNGVLALSREAGAVFELGDDALVLNPFDVSGTAQVLERALDMDPEERQRRSQALKAKSSARRPQDWLADQQDAITDAASHNRV